MALRFSSIVYDENKFIKRLDAKYYQLNKTLEKIKSNSLFSIDEFSKYIENITDGEHSGQKFVNEGVLFLKNSSIKDFDISINDGFYISREKHNTLKRSALQENDVLFTTIGHLGSAAIVPKNFGEANMNQNFVKIKVKEIDPYYLVAYLNSKFVKLQIDSLLTGNIQSILTYPKIKAIKIILPNDVNIINLIRENYIQAINFSNKANILIKECLAILRRALRVENITRTEKIFSVKNNLFEDNLNFWTTDYYLPKYVEAENYFIKNFKNIELGKVAKVISGDEPGSDSYSSYLDKSNSDVPFIRTSDIYNYQIDSNPDNFIDVLTYEELNQDIFPGDILFTKDGKIGEIGMVTQQDKAIYSSGIAVIKINDEAKKFNITREYLFTCLLCEEIGQYSSKRYTVTASTIPHLKEKNIEKIIIPIVPDEIITEITQKINEAFKLIDKKKKRINECQEIINDFINQII